MGDLLSFRRTTNGLWTRGNSSPLGRTSLKLEQNFKQLPRQQSDRLMNLIQRFVALAERNPGAANLVLKTGDTVLRSFGA